MDELPEPQRRVILLRDFDGLPWGEVARVLGKNTDSAARELHRRALLQLAQRLAARGRGPAAAPDGG